MLSIQPTMDTNTSFTPLESALRKVGYVRSPNKIWTDIPWNENGTSPLWYAGGPGLPEPKFPYEVQCQGCGIRIFKPAEHLTTETVQWFYNVPDFLAWCRDNGQISEPGQAAFSNSWD